MKTKTYIKALMNTSFSFPLDEINSIMEEELQKEPEEMDGELVDLCIDILEKGYAEQEQKQKQEQERAEKKHTGTKVRRVLIVAAIIVLIIAVAVPVSAAFSHNKVSDKIVQFCSDYFHMDLRKGSTNANHYSNNNSDLIKELKERGFEYVILPSDLLSFDYSKDIVVQEGDDYFTSAIIDIQDTESKIKGRITITQYDDSTSFVLGDVKVSSRFERIEQINVNGLDIIVYCNDNNETLIRYLDTNTNYSIALTNCDFEKAVEIANTLK